MTRINLTELQADREAGAQYGEEEWTMHKCQCGHPSCDQWTFSEMGSAGIYGNAARRIARLPDLEAAYIEAVGLLRRFIEVNDEPCWWDHHGYCQAHYLEDDCMVAAARNFLGDK